MEVSCTSCPARFAVPDDKVRGRKVRIACKRCGAPIIVDGTVLGAEAPPSGAAKPAAAVKAPAPVTAPKPVVAPKPLGAAPKPAPAPVPAPKPQPAPASKPQPAPASTPASTPRPAQKPPSTTEENDWSALSDSGGKAAAWREPASALKPPASVPRPGGAPAPKVGGFGKKTMLGGLEAPRGAAPSPPSTDKLGVPPRPAAPLSRPGAPPKDEEVEPEWTVALSDTQHEEMRTAEVVQLYARGSIDQETFIWADGMEDWKRPWEIPMIAAALAARGLKPKEQGEEPARSESGFPMDEPEEGDATIVASLGQLMPPSSRGKMPSGVWHEPGRDDETDDVGFEDVTVSLDGKSAADLLKGLADAGGPAPAPAADRQSKAQLAASQFDDVPTRVQDELEMPPPASVGGGEVDDLLSDMEERTLALQEDALQHSQRAMSAADLMSEDETTIEQRPPIGAGESFSLGDLMGGVQPPPAPAPDLFAGVGMGPPPAGRDRPLDSLWEPTGIQPAASSPLGSPVPVSGPMSAPYPMAGPAAGPALAPKKKSALGCVLAALLVLVLVVGAGAASFFTKQPASLYGPDGRPKIPGLTQ